MATIRPNDNAPEGKVKYLLGNAEFDLATGGSYETDDRYVLAGAGVHPWLTVEYPEVPELGQERVSKSVPYEEDYLSAPNSQAFNLDQLRKEQEAAAEVLDSRLAVDAGLDQSEEAEVAGVDVTLAAATADEEPPKKSTKTAKGKG